MAKDLPKTGPLNSKELEAVYTMSHVATHALDVDAGLDEIINIARQVFIFDNVVLYFQQEQDSLEPSFARALGRGRSDEDDLAWGEATAIEALETGKLVIRHEILGDYSKDRMMLRFFLGLPMTVRERQVGVLVFVRYGGPPFTDSNFPLAEFIAVHIAQLLEHQQLVKHLSSIEDELRIERLQDDFVSTITHELCTPLGFIKGYATTLLREDTNWDEKTRREFLTIIDEEADRLRELIDNLLDSSRLQSGTLRMEFQPVRLDTMLKDVSMRADAFENKISVNLDLNSTGVIVNADPTRVAQVFDNLLSNAAKYAPNCQVILSLDTEGSLAHISVKDNGPGIAPEHLENIFMRFYRIPNQTNSVRGSGLGLFICRRILRAHKGEITVESKLGEGTTFHVYLPLSQNS
ncbi:MAG: GAF domain-containing protein [Anaerolineales bacterium]|nr:GAF domain-containing protein [Anaerolineales bacterium]